VEITPTKAQALMSKAPMDRPTLLGHVFHTGARTPDQVAYVTDTLAMDFPDCERTAHTPLPEGGTRIVLTLMD